MKKETLTAVALGVATISAGMNANVHADVVENNSKSIDSEKSVSMPSQTTSNEVKLKSSVSQNTVSSESTQSSSTLKNDSSSQTSNQDKSENITSDSSSISNPSTTSKSSSIVTSNSSSTESISNSSSSEAVSSDSSSVSSLSKSLTESSSTNSSISASSSNDSSATSTSKNMEQSSNVNKRSDNTHNISEMVEKEAAQNKKEFEKQLSNPDARAAYNKLNTQAKKVAQAANINLAKLTHDEINALNSVKLENTPESGTVTYKDYENIAHSLINRDPRYEIPKFDANKIKNFPAITTKDAQSGKIESLDIWDSWPVMDANTGAVTNWNGYQLVFGMAGKPKDWGDNHLYLLYTKYGDQNFNDWKCAGPVFGFNQNSTHQRWSGSASVNSDGTIQLYYTDVDTSTKHNDQKIATVTINLALNNGKISIVSRENEKILFKGDGKYYQTFDQFKNGNMNIDNFCLRDPHIFVDNGNRYLIFEGSTGTENYQSANQIYNLGNYGGSTIADDVNAMFKIVNNNDMTARATYANAAIGILELGGTEKNPTVKAVDAPLIQAPLTTDEIERPDLIKINGKYYLFADARLNRGTNDPMWKAADKAVGDNVVMLGFVSDHLTYGYKPLNGSGVVLTASTNANSRTATYAYYAVPILDKNGNPTNYVLITDYMSNRGWASGKNNNSTWGPSFIVEILPDGTTRVIQNSVTSQQGVWVLEDGTKLISIKNGLKVVEINYNSPLKETNTKLIHKNNNAVYADTVDTIKNVQSQKQENEQVLSTNKDDVIHFTTTAPTSIVQNDVRKVVKEDTLPQTGDNNSKATLWGEISLAMASLLATLGLSKRKRRE